MGGNDTLHEKVYLFIDAYLTAIDGVLLRQHSVVLQRVLTLTQQVIPDGVISSAGIAIRSHFENPFRLRVHESDPYTIIVLNIVVHLLALVGVVVVHSLSVILASLSALSDRLRAGSRLKRETERVAQLPFCRLT